MNSRRMVLTGMWVLAAGGAAIGWYKFVARPTRTVCGYCNRPLHSNSMVTAEIEGKRTQACCARCAISEANQLHKALRLVEVHDYHSSKALLPENAWFVEGSRVIACEHEMTRMGDHKDMQDMAFDRCSPGTLAFANQSDAESFEARNGGTVRSLLQLMSEARFQ